MSNDVLVILIVLLAGGCGLTFGYALGLNRKAA